VLPQTRRDFVLVRKNLESSYRMSERDKEHTDTWYRIPIQTIKSVTINTKMTFFRKSYNESREAARLDTTIAKNLTHSNSVSHIKSDNDNYTHFPKMEIGDLRISCLIPLILLSGFRFIIRDLLHPSPVLLTRSPQHKCRALILPGTRSERYFHEGALSRLIVARPCELREP